MKYNLIFFLIFFCSLGHAAIIIWPDTSSPCNGSLQACINSSNEGDTVEIQTNATIDEDLFIDAAISIISGVGYKPVFSSGNSLQIYSVSSGSRLSVSIKGLTFERGTILVGATNRPITYYIENNTVLDNLADTPAISISSSAPEESETIVHVNYNRVNIDSSNSTFPSLSAILINKNGLGSGDVSGEVINNTIHAAGLESIGIYLSIINNPDISLNITGNEIYGGNAGGIDARIHTNGNVDLDISSNVFYRESLAFESSGIHISSFSGSTNADIINNTMINSLYGIRLWESGGSLTANVHNNIAAYCTFGYFFRSDVDVISDYNLSYQNTSHQNYIPGPNAISADPKIIGFHNGRLKPDSPALESGNPLGLLLVADAPLIDADGLHRTKKSSGSGSGVIDIGAYEAGDVSFNHKHSASDTHVSVIDNQATNDLPSLDNLHITSNWNPDVFNGVYNNANEGLFFGNNRWRIFNQDIQHIETGASFNIAKLASTANTFEHIVNNSNENSSTINHMGLNGNSSKILQVSQHYGVYNPHPSGILYLAGHWRVVNLDAQNLSISSKFNIYYQDNSKSAYEHISNDVNTQNNYTFLDNHLINGVHCAQIQVTQSVSQGIFNDSPIGVFYDSESKKWAIFNQDLSAMPGNAAFHVLINPAQIAACNDVIFKNGFE